MTSDPSTASPQAAPGGRLDARHRACRWLLAAVLLIAFDAEAEPGAPLPSYSGWLHVIWGDGFGGPSTATSRHVLVDDHGQWHHLRLDPRLLHKLGSGVHGAQRLRVRVTGRPEPADHRRGAAQAPATIDVHGVEFDAAPLSAATPLAAGGAQPWVTILCRFADSASVTPRPKSYFDGLLGQVAPGMGHYWDELSYGRLSLAGSAVLGWYDLPRPRSYYVYPATPGDAEHLDFQRSVEDCTAAADRDVSLPAFSGINLMFNDTLDCCSWGGSATLTRDGQTRSYGVTWLPPWAYAHQYVVAHEMGHGLGLPHSSGPYASPYDSDWDPMSGGGVCASPDAAYGCVGVHTISYHKALLGWIPPEQTFSPIPGLTETIDLERLAQPAAGASHLMARIPIPGSATRFYTVEARRPAGYDGQIPGPAVVIHQVDAAQSDRPARVVDPDGNGNVNDAGAMWVPGETFTDLSNQITVSVADATPSGYRVAILTGGFRVSVGRSGVGAGSVASAPPGIACPPACDAVYGAGTSVSLTAIPDPGSAVLGWSGCDAISGATCRVTVGPNRPVSVAFGRQAHLSVEVTGAGRVTSVPPGLDCGSTCSAGFAAGSTITLVASAGPSHVFAGFSGPPDCADGVVVLGGDIACGARFDPVADLVVTSVGDPPLSARPGSRIAVTDTVLNEGLAGAGAFRMRYYLSADPVAGGGKLLLGRRAVAGLAPGTASTGTAVVWIPLSTSPGSYHVLACADGLDAVDESDETDNCRPSTGHVEVSWRP